ncbi:MAG: fibronectin type III domain-containing protein [Acidimicrobiales bacterium]
MTRGHSERVRVLTDLIADQLRLPQHDRDRLRWSALLHDVGKLAGPRGVLNKPDKPNPSEWTVLRNHPLEGARLTAPLADWLGPWAAAILQHHERWDGTGYPYGLAGEDISLGGRIVAVADAYETMTAVRSYKKPVPAQAARGELATCAGRQFDPVVVRAFLEASVGRIHALGGPLAWLGELRQLRGIPNIGRLATTAQQVATGAAVAAGVGVAAAAAASAHHAPVRDRPASVTSAPAPAPRSSGTGGSRRSVTPARGPRAGHAASRGHRVPATASRPLSTIPVAFPAAPPRTAPPPAPPPATPPTAAPPATPPTAPLPTAAPPLTAAPPPTSAPPTTTAPPTTAPPPTTPPTSVPHPTTVPPPAAVPSAPSWLSGRAGDQQVTLTWAPPTDDGSSPVTAYTVVPYQGGLAQAPETFDSPATTEVVSGLIDGDWYTFVVVADNAAGAGAPSPQSPQLRPVGAPSAPTGVTGTPGAGQVSLSWTAPLTDGGSPISSYTVTPFSGGTALAPKTFDSAATTATITGLADGVTYTFEVAATNDLYTSDPSEPSPPVTPAGVPSIPTGVTATGGDGQATLTWAAPVSDGGSPLTGYLVTPSLNGVPQSTITFGPAADTTTITGLTNGATYTFVVAATNAVGSSDPSGPSAPVMPSAVPSAPTGIVAVAGDQQVQLSWTAPAGDGGSPVTNYVVTPYLAGVAQGSQTFGAGTAATVNGLTDGSSYTFTVAAVNQAGTGPASAPSAAVVPHGGPPAPPSGVDAVAGIGAVTLSWNAPSSPGGPITSYTVIPYIGGVAQPSETFGTSTTEVISGLIPGIYTFVVVATNAGGDSGPSAPTPPLLVL